MILRTLINICRVSFIAAISLICSYGLLSWFHDSWFTDTPVLGFLEPLIAVAVQLGELCATLLSSPAKIQGGLLLLGLLALIGAIIGRAYRAVPLIAGFVALLTAPLLAAGNITLYYSIIAAVILVLIICFLFTDRKSSGEVQEGPTPYIALFFILCAALIFRFYMLDSLPPGISDEDAGIALKFKEYVNGNKNVIRDHFFKDTPLEYIGNLATILSVTFFKLFGYTPLAYRMVPATAGVLAVLVLFFLVKRMFGVKPALFAALFMAVSPWHTFYSRTNFPQTGITVLHAILTYYLLVAALEKQKPHLFALLGVFMGLSVYVYEPGKVTLGATGLIILLFFLGEALLHKPSLRKTLLLTGKGLIVLIFLAVTITPYIRWGLKEKSYFYSAAGSVNLKKAFWESQGKAPGIAEHLTTNLQHLPTMLAFSRKSPPNSHTTSRYAHPEKGLIDFLTLGFMVMGLAFSLGNFRKRPYFILLLWGATALMPAMFTAILSKRLTPVLPVIFIWAGIGAAQFHSALASLAQNQRFRQALTSTFVILLLFFTTYQLRDFFEKTPYLPSLHPAYSVHRDALLKARVESDFYTDVSNSIYFFILVDHPLLSTQKELSRNILSILAANRTTGKDLSIVASPRVVGNRQMVTAMQDFFAETTFLDTEDFFLLTIHRQQLDSFFGFPEPEKISTPQRGDIYRFQGTLVVPVAGHYGLNENSFFVSVIIDGHPFSISREIKPPSYQWLGAGSHKIIVEQKDAASPRLQWLPQKRFSEKQQFPFVAKPQFHEINLFQSAPARTTKAKYELGKKIQLGSSTAYARPVDLQIGPAGNFYITDAGKKQVSVTKPDGTAISQTNSEPWTPHAAVPSAKGGMYVLLPWSQNGLLRYDGAGIKTHTFALNGTEMFLGEISEMFLVRGSSLIKYSLDTDFKPIVESKFSLPETSQSKIVTAAMGPENMIHVLSGDAKLYTLDTSMAVYNRVTIDPQAVSSSSKLAVDHKGRRYINDLLNNKIHVFDKEGNLLLGSTEDSNCPIDISSPIDILFWNKQLYVLNKEINLFNVTVIKITE